MAMSRIQFAATTQAISGFRQDGRNQKITY
jgi:hypothetical protein